jgi:hypothetical protein
MGSVRQAADETVECVVVKVNSQVVIWFILFVFTQSIIQHVLTLWFFAFPETPFSMSNSIAKFVAIVNALHHLSWFVDLVNQSSMMISLFGLEVNQFVRFAYIRLLRL